MKCEIEGCNNEAARLDMCFTHYNRLRKNGTTDDPIPYVQCSVEGCNEMIRSKIGLCSRHYKQRWYLNSVGRETLLERTSQEFWINMQTGYVMVKQNGKLVYEHRVLAEKALGYPLPPQAVVHHMSDRHDNHGPFKLVICPDQEYHSLLHKRMRELGYESN